jgi:hypothetical protein
MRTSARHVLLMAGALLGMLTYQSVGPWSDSLSVLANEGNGYAKGHLKSHGHNRFFDDEFKFNHGHFHFSMRGPHFKQRSNPFINVKSDPYKAKGDGVTDDTNAIQTAANDAMAEHKFLFFPAGDYLHAGTLTFNSIAATGVGSPTRLIANNEESSAVILTGSNVSLENMIVSTQGLVDNNETTPSLSEGNVVVENAANFAVANATILQGTNEIGVYVFNSSVGTVTSNMFDGTGTAGDTGVLIDQAADVSVVSNGFQFEDIGVNVSPNGTASQTIAINSNAIGNSTFTTGTAGIEASGATTVEISMNSIYMANDTTSTAAILLSNDDNIFVSQNSTFNGINGVSLSGTGATNSNAVSQNMIQGCGAAGIFLVNGATTDIQLASNTFGECGLTDSGLSTNNAVILVTGNSASGNTTFIENNVYQGHNNGLTSYITSAFHIPGANVSGNTQSQTTLPNNIP